MSRPIHFDVQVNDIHRAINFYQEIFGWKVEEYIPGFYWAITTGEEGTPGINGGMMLREGPPPATDSASTAFVCTLGVDDLDATMAAVRKAGGEIIVPKQAIPGVGWLFYFTDTEGNRVGAMQQDPNAA